MKYKEVFFWVGSINRFLKIYSYRNFLVCQLTYWFYTTSEPELAAEIQSIIGGKVWGEKVAENRTPPVPQSTLALEEAGKGSAPVSRLDLYSSTPKQTLPKDRHAEILLP